MLRAIIALLGLAVILPAAGLPQAKTVYTSKLESEKIAYRVVYKFTRTLAPGRMKKVQNGENGLLIRMVQYAARGAETVRLKTLWETRKEPVDAVIQIGKGGYQTTRGSFIRKKILELEATAYCAGACCGTGSGITSIGLKAGYGVVAVDPKVIPLGSRLFIEGYGFAIAGDTGGAVNGLRIDLGLKSHAEAIRFGRKKVRVHILE